MADKTNLPSVSSDIPRDLRAWLDRAREMLSDRFVTVEDYNQGTVPGGSGLPGGNGGDGGGGGGGGGW